MAPVSGSHVSTHFSRAELNYDSAPIAARRSLEVLAQLLEVVRSVAGVPLRVTSGYRSRAHNDSLVGASSSSQHLDGTAADFIPQGITVPEFMRRIGGSAVQGAFGQLILYPLGSNHVHISLPTRGVVGQVLVQVSPDASAPRYEPYNQGRLVALDQQNVARQAIGAVVAAGAIAVGLPRRS